MSYQDTLKNILRFAQSVDSKCSTKLHKQSPQRLTGGAIIPSPVLSLPLPEGITPSLLHSIECSPAAARALSTAFVCSALKIRTAHESAFRNIARHHCSNSSSLSSRLKNVASFLEKEYHEQLRVAERRTIEQAQQLHFAKHTKSKPTFNQEFVPLLEKYFEYNAYPSGPDRAALARKSMMTPRQIEVWFQNHRNRAKKEGKALHKLTSNPIQLSIKSLEEKMPFFVIPEHERKDRAPVDASDSPSGDDSEDELQVSAQSFEKDSHTEFTLNAPSHAFPTTYPLSCNYHPFPRKTEKYKFPAPAWTRTPATSLPEGSAVNLEDFVTDFASKLVIGDASSKAQPRKVPNTAERRPWFSATHTTPPPAPHPAFIRPLTSPPITSDLVAPLPTVYAPLSRRHPFRSPSPCSPLTSLVPAVQNNTPTRRKVARLPKRLPRSVSLAHRAGSPVTSTGSPTPPNSRTSSSGSIGASSRRPSSSSSSSSSGPSTPASSPTLPENIQLPYVFESWDVQRGGGLFGDFVSPVLQIDADADFAFKNPVTGTALQ